MLTIHRRNVSYLLISFALIACVGGPATAAPGNGNGHAGGGSGNASDQACWGQATRVFAHTGAMGYHASQQENPRLGLRNLAVALYEDGWIEAPTLQALGAFVSEDVSACQ